MPRTGELAAAAERTRREVEIQKLWNGGGRDRTGCFRPGHSGNPSGKRAGCLPIQVFPKIIERQYAAEIIQILRRLRDAYAQVLLDAPKLAREATLERQRLDAGEGRQGRALLEQARTMARQLMGTGELESLAERFARKTSEHNRAQLARQTRAALGVDVFARDRKLAALTDDFVQYNASLISRIPDRLHAEVETLVQQAITAGQTNDTLAEDLVKRFNIAEKHAKLIARDQIGKFYGDVNTARQRELGINRFIWRTANDERVRHSHEELDGNTYSYDDLPKNDRGEAIKPGDDIQCRCYAEPVFADILDAPDEEETRTDSYYLADGDSDMAELREVQDMIRRFRRA